MPRVSVILPNYNYARFLKERIRSVLGQTMRDFEFIYVDDGSTDGSNDLAAQFASDPRMRMLLHEQNSGTVYRRWNEAAADAKGDWLWFPNADDSAHPRFLERLLQVGEARPNVGIAHARVAKMDANGRLLGLKLFGSVSMMEHLERDYWASGYEEIPRLAAGLYLPTASSIMFRRDAFQAVSGFDERLWGAADYDLYMRLLHRYDIAYSCDLLAYYREHGSNTTVTTKALIHALALSYSFATAYRRMDGDPRYSDATRDIVLRCARSHLFDMFATPGVTPPPALGFAVEAIYEVTRDARLLRLLEAHKRALPTG